MLKLVDKPDLGSGAARRVGSSPPVRTNPKIFFGFFLFRGLELAAAITKLGVMSTGHYVFLLLPPVRTNPKIFFGFFFFR